MKPPRSCPRLPIIPYILRQIKSVLSNSFNDVMIWAAMCTGFFGFLRAGEFTVEGAFDPTAHLSYKDICIDSHTQPSLVRLLIKKSKTDQFGGTYKLRSMSRHRDTQLSSYSSSCSRTYISYVGAASRKV